MVEVSGVESEEGTDKETVGDLKQNLKRKGDNKNPKGSTKPGGC